MGLDTVEIVLWAEEEFDVSMPDEEVGKIYTVGEFATYIAQKVNEAKGSSIDYSDTLPKILDVLESDYGVERTEVTLSSRFVQDLGFG
jgi:acyl carrier protein